MAFMASGGYTGIGAQVPDVKVRALVPFRVQDLQILAHHCMPQQPSCCGGEWAALEQCAAQRSAVRLG